MVEVASIISQNPYLWFVFLLLLFSGIFYIIWHNGIQIKDKIIIPSKDERRKANSILEEIHYYIKPDYLEKVEDEYIGFVIKNKPYVEIFGRLWNTTDHHKHIDKLRQSWRNEQSISIIGSNIPSDILALIEEKLQELEHLEIYCSLDQQRLLENYLSSYPNKKIKAR